MNDGKKIERFTRLIQETLKNIPQTKIYSNYQIKNKSGRKREIDVLIKSRINNLDIIIVIECKDYKRPVPVDKIESFNSKCQRIEGISKKVFVATNGYQADSIEAAKHFDIELYNLSEISKKEITTWFPIKQLKINIKLQLPFKIQVIGEESDFGNLPYDNELIVHYFGKEESIQISGFVWNSVVVKKQKEIQSLLFIDFMKRKSNDKIDKQTRIPFTLKVSGIYVLGKENKKLKISKIESEIVCWFEETPANIIEARKYEQSGSNPEASIVSLDVGREEVADIIFTQEDDISIFHTKNDGQIYQLKTLASYDPKTDKLEIMKQNKNEG